MQIALFGGSFDPVHLGHIALVELLQKKFDSVILIPANLSPLKSKNYTLAAHRLKMLRLAFENKAKVSIETYELDKGGISYFFETLCFLYEKYPEVTHFNLVIGADQANCFQQWFRYKEILQRVKLIVATRKDIVLQSTNILRDYSLLAFHHPCSSSAIRLELQKSGGADACLEEKVAQYIKSHQLYHHEIESDMFANLRNHIRSTLSEKRVLHIFAVEELIVQLAERFSFEQREARLVALGHDLLREHSDEQLLTMAKENSIKVHDIEQHTPMLLHGVLAYLELNKWCVVNDEMAHAMRVHTLGEAKMSKLAKLLYCADYLEPRRPYLKREERERLLALPLQEMFSSVAKQRCAYIQKCQPLAAASKRMLDSLCS